MKHTWITPMAAALAVASVPQVAMAQHPALHVNPRWKSCAIQLDASLTQAQWHQFSREVGVLGYFRPLADARPMGAGRMELSILQWRTGVDEDTPAWNNTFVHPDSTHWLTGESSLPIPGLGFRAGVSSRVDVGAYFTTNPQSNYGLYGGQVQYNVARDAENRTAASARLSVVRLFGPADVDLTILGADAMASRTWRVTGGITLSPYAGATAMLSATHEKSPLVSLKDEQIFGVMGTVGAVARISRASLGVEYNVASVNALSFKVGVGF